VTLPTVGSRVRILEDGMLFAGGQCGTVVEHRTMHDGQPGVTVELDDPLAPEPPFWEQPITHMMFWPGELQPDNPT